MNKRIAFRMALAVLLVAFMGACTQPAQQMVGQDASDLASGGQAARTSAPEAVEVEDRTLDDWNGQWNALVTYLDDEETASALDADDAWKEEQATDLLSFRLELTSLTAYSEPQKAGGRFPSGDILFDYSYRFVGAVKDADGIYWYQFKASTPSSYQYLMLTDVDENTIPSFYIRYGSDGFDPLFEKTNWRPMMVSREASAEDIAALVG